ncbi:BRE1 E3 ubiquitin ligase-domain-containing protein [Mycena belliarum]|uniref:E3 ubiquitin protein ligase n=1 Tax=Mycena belliarum TaxID=1033014 RepID=A0AAD6TRY5_9AGAR|nr:BRE1 E3 ubiquitin ligase-domain-containing protein [Mycena belliae]
MESKKRPHAQEVDVSVAKKRILSGANGAPYVNGSTPDIEEPSDLDNLEVFRKEAIFRRMKHYSREHDRSQSRIAELERRKNTCEAGLAAMAACWTQLVEAIRLLAKPEDLPPTPPNTRDLFDISSHISEDEAPDLVSALQDNMHATRNLVTKFAKLGSGSQLTGGDAYMRCQKVQTECTALRSEMQVIHTKLRETEAQKDRYYESLLAAETAADRLRSKTVLAMKPQSQGASVESPREVTEEQKNPSSPVPPPQHTTGINGHTDLSELKDRMYMADLREAEVQQLRREVAELNALNRSNSFKLKVLPVESIVESPTYKVLLEHASYLTHALSESQLENNRLSEELQTVLDSRREWQEAVESAANQANQELKSLITKRDAENTRLREQREQQAAELNERKQKDAVKLASMKELESLAEARSARILVLESQLSRHKAQLAANVGNEDLMRFFFSGQLDDMAYIEELKNRVMVAEQRAAALDQTLSIFQDDHPNVVQHMEAEANALQRLTAATLKLEKYEQTYGDPSTLPPDVARLADKLREQEAEIKILRSVNTQHTKDKAPVYSELDQLSAAWEALDRQVKSKVFDLKDMEERVSKSGLDKAKSDNKFFSAMRDKEVVESERKNLARNVEKLGKVVDRLTESERNLSTQVMSLDKDLASVRRQYEARVVEIAGLRREIRDLKILHEGEVGKSAECQTVIIALEEETAKKKAELQKMTDELALLKKQMERQSVELQERATGSSSSREIELQNELKLTMNVLKCTACKGAEFRNTVLIKCMHTFCRSCVDSRVTTRQRKCPACNLAFGNNDIQTIYLQ